GEPGRAGGGRRRFEELDEPSLETPEGEVTLYHECANIGPAPPPEKAEVEEQQFRGLNAPGLFSPVSLIRYNSPVGMLKDSSLDKISTATSLDGAVKGDLAAQGYLLERFQSLLA